MLIQAEYSENSSRGIQRIEIPKTAADFLPSNGYGLSAVRKYLPNAVTTHKANASKELFFYDYYLGLQDIYKKERLYQKDSINNNKICENHAFSQVAFKVAFITSEEREYTAKEGVLTNEAVKDDFTYFNRYLTDVNFFGKDKTLKEWIYITGVGTTDIRPRRDMIIANGDEYRFATREDGFDIQYNSPFDFNVVSPLENFVVYSSGRNKEPLFCVTMVEVERNPDNEKDTSTEIEYIIETKYAIFKARSTIGFSDYNNYSFETIKTTNNIIPIVEHAANNSRLGLIERNKSLFDCINTLVSSIADMVVDNANVILVFKNTDITAQQVQAMKKAGAIIIKDSASFGRQNSVADLDTIKIQIDYKGLNDYYEQRLTQAYDSAGVPLASGQVTSGGDTGQARLLGGGWNNAKTISMSETNTMKISDYEVLKQMIYLCSLYPSCPLDTITASQIDIKYKTDSSDNFLVKAQGIRDLYDVNMPKEMILKASGLLNDIGAGAKQWEEYDRQVKEEAKAVERIDVVEERQPQRNGTNSSNGEKNNTDSEVQ